MSPMQYYPKTDIEEDLCKILGEPYVPPPSLGLIDDSMEMSLVPPPPLPLYSKEMSHLYARPPPAFSYNAYFTSSSEYFFVGICQERFATHLFFF
ncbi:Hypothetical predicted protein [Prunus dulcis]|uniref:Uncharacterized protein n=1 Tax=Prunus dulcis TaxID=3755 RepID=A0A5E4GDJ4_PRUDU|nr:hypothetical protein L3X38_037327 [Prunus dulcis]VVA37874.1 Hypothetical predicted protein [Prunus dulcis]